MLLRASLAHEVVLQEVVGDVAVAATEETIKALDPVVDLAEDAAEKGLDLGKKAAGGAFDLLGDGFNKAMDATGLGDIWEKIKNYAYYGAIVIAVIIVLVILLKIKNLVMGSKVSVNLRQPSMGGPMMGGPMMGGPMYR